MNLRTKTVKYDNGLGEVIYTKYPQSRSIRVFVTSRAQVKVTLPVYASFQDAEHFLFSVGGKIIAQRREILSRSQSPMIQQPGGSDTTSNKSMQPGAMSLYEINKLAHKILPARTRQMYELMSKKVHIRNSRGEVVEDPFRYNRVAIKNNSSNWGSCSTLRNINLNMHLVRLPEELMDYVIAHELCHLVYPNHSPRFHALLNAITDGKEKNLAARLRRIKL